MEASTGKARACARHLQPLQGACNTAAFILSIAA